ncbi:MAG TPA: GxxExxY protein [bacterium]|nr:GxxExxY protein [bacterium]
MKNDIDPKINGFAKQVVDCAFEVHSTLGPGLLESIYETCLAHEIALRRLKVQRQVALPVSYKGMEFDDGLRIDLLIEGALIVEVKTVESLLPVHQAQLLTYLKLTGCTLGLLINFHVPLIKLGIQRVVCSKE